MNIPTYLKQQVIDPKTGFYTDSAHLYQQQLNQELQSSFTQTGINLPPVTNSQINDATAPANPNSIQGCSVFFNSDTGAPQIVINGVVKTFVLS